MTALIGQSLSGSAAMASPPALAGLLLLSLVLLLRTLNGAAMERARR